MMIVTGLESARLAETIRDKYGAPATYVFGPYDVVVELQADAFDALSATSLKIRELAGFATSTTFVVQDDAVKKGDRAPSAFTLVGVPPGATLEEIKSIREVFFALPEVTKADIVMGIYDIVVEFHVKTMEELAKAIRKARTDAHLFRTITMVALPVE